ncbi:methanobactin export MATE transporter MbnM [Thiomicrorhabdus indica]|uniref:methanobactin export MATE transporter MbnM n=1 Tax=Thiomicrorhabdus indica TaxID=2267253 RepID=UPI00102D8453|nr:methanobactin export MATE transporter MbnM [Thiomicrorhabdus indica]
MSKFSFKAIFASPMAFLALSIPLMQGCVGGGTEVTDTDVATAEWRWELPPNFPTPAVPEDNPMSEAKFQLGRHLFYDKRLSGNQTFSCASCHHQDKAFTDGKAFSIGSTGDVLTRNSPSLVNSAYHSTYTWVDPNLMTLEAQMLTPLFATKTVEMGINDTNREEVLLRFRQDEDYQRMFTTAFPGAGDAIDFELIIKAIATFQRALLTGHSKFEQYQQGIVRLSPSEDRGRVLFNSEQAECFHCHGSFNFNDQVTFAGSRVEPNFFHNTGLYNIGDHGDFPPDNQGLFAFTELETDKGLFRAQSLWNVGVTAPYMHDGSIATLEEVLDFYADGGRNITEGEYAGDGRKNPYKSDLIGLINLSEQDKADLVAFLRTLTDERLLSDERFSNPFAE